MRLLNTPHALFARQGHTAIVKKNLATAERLLISLCQFFS
jgi:hypothetical protein